MGNNFTLELDTTAPILNLFIPNYTSPNIDTEFFIYLNEDIMSVEECYVIDPNNIRHDYTFSVQDEYIYGMINFGEEFTGVNTFYISVKDLVLNESILYSHEIQIFEAIDLEITLKEPICFSQYISNSNRCRSISVNKKNMDSNINLEESDCKCQKHTQNISLEIQLG